MGTGVAVSCQLKRLGALLESDTTLLRAVERIDSQLDKESKSEMASNFYSKG